MSRPPPIPPGDASPAPGGRARTEGASATAPQNPAPHNPHHSSVPAGDMEALLRNWGVSSTDVSMVGSSRGGWAHGSTAGWTSSRNAGLDFEDTLRMDRSASFDGDDRHHAPQTGDHLQSSRHKRIASTGGNRIAIDLASIAMISGDLPESEAEIIYNGSELHDAARITDWPTVAALSQSNPELARYVGPDGWNALHHACDRRCPYVDVMDSLLSAHPEALIQPNDKGWTPLHRACRNKTPRDVVRLLLRQHPELGKRAAAMRCNDGRSALHYALLYDAPEGVAELLLQADPGAVLDEDRDGVSPLGTVWDKYANSFDGRRTLQILLRPFEGEGWELGGNEAAAEGAERELNRQSEREAAERRVKEYMERPVGKVLLAKWQKTVMLLRASFSFPLHDGKTSGMKEGDSSPRASPRASPRSSPRPSPERRSSFARMEATPSRKRKWRVLHATSAIKCHPTLFLLARALHPEEALEVDENDLIVGGRDIHQASQDPVSSHRTALHFAAMSPLAGREGRNVVKVLLKLNPHAASHVDGYSNFPLHLIAENDRKLHWANDGVMDVSNAHAAALSCKDSLGRTPLHCAASSPNHCTAPRLPPTIVREHGVAAPQASTPGEGSVIANLVYANHTAASMADDSGRLPLHYMAEHGEEWCIEAQSMLDAHPAAARTRAGPSASNQLPLHMAAASPDSRPSLVMNLVNANPRAASLTDATGRLPLHLAVDSGRTTWDRGIDSIYRAYTPAISAPEESPRRWTVLHTAVASHSAGRLLIEEILGLDIFRLDGNAASVADGQGRYPLHLACAANRPWEDGGVRAIFDADPSVALMEDANGFLPFHVAAMSSPRSASESIEENEPANVSLESAARDDGDSDDLESLQVVFNLLRAQPNIVQL